MPSINMIAPRRAEKMRLERDIRRLVVLILAELIIALAIGGWVCTKYLTTRGQIADLDMQIAKLQPVVNKIKDYDDATAKLSPKLDLLNTAKDGTMRWYNMLDKLTQSMPESTYLTRVSTSNSGTDTSTATVNLNGVSVAQAKVGEMMIRLQAVPDFERVDLHFTQKTDVKSASALEFEIGAAMKISNQKEGDKTDGTSKS